MIISKQNIVTYKNILLHSSPKYQIYKYIVKRLLGIDAKFTKNVYVKDGYNWLNCGRIMENCKVAADNFESGVKKVIDNHPKGTFIDIGAHIGKHSVYANTNGFRTICIEADGDNYDLLVDNLISNRGELFSTHNNVLSDKKEKVIFNRSELHPATSSIMVERENAEKVELQADTLDNVLKDVKIKRPVLMKIDVEGAELKVLKGASKFLRQYKPNIIFEAWNFNSALQIGTYLYKFGYGIKQLDNEFNWVAFQRGKSK